MKVYRHLFFDLDRTLWDFERNSKETLQDLFHHYKIKDKSEATLDSFITVYKAKNDLLWKAYRNGEITKDELRKERFYQTLKHFGLNDADLALTFNNRYVESCSSKTHLIPNALETLDYLKEKYQLHIITNGFIEAQSVKLKSSGLEQYFDAIVVSDGLGYRKPDKRIFHHALKMAKATQSESLMIGDDYVPDIVGAKVVGMDQVFFTPHKNPEETATYTIHNLLELKTIL